MGKPIKEVTIVGGGTAGWLTALLLDRLLNAAQKDRRKKLKVTLIESPNIPTVGVGEATVPNMPRTLREGGISERQFFKECNASFKLGVMFANWNVNRQGKRIDYINPFAAAPNIHGVEASQYFAELGGGGMDFIESICPTPELARHCKGPRPLGLKEFQAPIGFAYHLDAGAFANLLRDVCTERGVKHIRQNVLDVKQDEKGFVSGLELEETGHHPVELVIDCTGFRGMIINKVLGEPFVDYGKYLANDRAMAVQIPHAEPDKIEPITRSTALGAGWSWRVPLYHRVGTGYVFSSAHRTDEEARDEFMAHLGPIADGLEPRVIPMRVGRSRNAWVKNCVAIGLSGGFIEPLESTAIHMVDMMVRWLAIYFPDSDHPEALRNRFNKSAETLYDEVLNFICLHYRLGNRTDSQYWIDAREELEIPDRLAENLDLWQYGLPTPLDLRLETLFPYGTYQAVLLGKQVYETGFGKGKFKPHRALDKDAWKNYLMAARKNAKTAVQQFADHKVLLSHLRGEPLKKAEPAAAKPAFSMQGGTVKMGNALPGSFKIELPKSLSGQPAEDEDAAIL